jgi:hypothetical protein
MKRAPVLAQENTNRAVVNFYSELKAAKEAERMQKVDRAIAAGRARFQAELPTEAMALAWLMMREEQTEDKILAMQMGILEAAFALEADLRRIEAETISRERERQHQERMGSHSSIPIIVVP